MLGIAELVPRLVRRETSSAILFRIDLCLFGFLVGLGFVVNDYAKELLPPQTNKIGQERNTPVRKCDCYSIDNLLQPTPLPYCRSLFLF